jgi:uncharacterized protein
LKTFAKRVSPSSHLIGLISDTHGLIRPEALDALRDSDLIIHCGDVGDPAVLDVLRSIAPVRAVRGNNDIGTWARSLPAYDVVEIDSHKIYVLHNLSELHHPDAAGFTAVVSGHSHKPLIGKRRGILFINRQCRAAPLQTADYSCHTHNTLLSLCREDRAALLIPTDSHPS